MEVPEKVGRAATLGRAFPSLLGCFSELILFSSLFLSSESSNLVTKIGLGEGEDAFPLQHRQHRQPRRRRRRSKSDNNGSSLAASSEDALDDYSDSKLSAELTRKRIVCGTTVRMRVNH